MKKYIDLVKTAFADWSEDEAPRLGAALSYYTILSIAPLLLILVAIIGLVYGQEAARGEIVSQFQGMVGTEGAKEIEQIIQSASKPSSGALASIFGIVMLLFGASGVVVELRDSLNRIWDVPKRQTTGLMATIKDRFFSLAMLLALGFLLLVSLVVSAVLAAMGKFMEGFLPLPEPVFQAINLLVSLALVTVVFALIFKYLPDAEITWNDVWWGAIVTAALFTIGKFVIGLYLGKADLGSTYGAAGSLVILLVWVYYSSQIFFFGAELTQAYASQYGSRLRLPKDAGKTVGPKEATPAEAIHATTAGRRPAPAATPATSGGRGMSSRFATLLAVLGFAGYGYYKKRR